MGTNRHFKRRTEELQLIATVALAGVAIERSYYVDGERRWLVVMPDKKMYYAKTKLQGAMFALAKLEEGLS